MLRTDTVHTHSIIGNIIIASSFDIRRRCVRNPRTIMTMPPSHRKGF